MVKKQNSKKDEVDTRETTILEKQALFDAAREKAMEAMGKIEEQKDAIDDEISNFDSYLKAWGSLLDELTETEEGMMEFVKKYGKAD